MKPSPGRPRILESGVEVKIELDGKVRSVIVTRETLNFHVGPPPPHVRQPSIERGWLGLVQHNMDRVRAGAERKLASMVPPADTILLSPGEVDLPKWT
jgi:hypothetical protein